MISLVVLGAVAVALVVDQVERRLDRRENAHDEADA